MKIISILLTLFMASTAFAEVKGLSFGEKKSLLKSLNQICGDSWCAGDFEYNFQAIDCDFTSGTCAIDLSVQSHDEIFYDDAGLESGRRAYPERRYACEVNGFGSKALVLDSSLSQYSEKLYGALSDCIAGRIAPVQNAIRFAWALDAAPKTWSLSRVVDCPSALEATRPLPSEYAFTAAMKEDFALIAALDRSGLDAAANPSCALKTYELSRESIRCVSGGVPAFCEVPFEDGTFLVSKDYVDSTLVTFEGLSESPKALPKTFAKNDGKMLYLPDPAACSDSLLAGYTQESTVSWSSLSAYRSGFDLRFVVAQLLREQVKDLSVAAADELKCKFVPTELPATSMLCEGMAQGQLCTLKSAQGGYWRVYLSTNGRVTSFFHRYD